MSESVTTLGNIPGTTGMYTAQQIDGMLSGLERLITASPEEISGAISAITQAASGFVTKDELAELVATPTTGGGILDLAAGAFSGAGVSGIEYWKNTGTSVPSHVRVIDEDMLSCGLSGLEEATQFVREISYYRSPWDVLFGIDRASELYCGFGGSESGHLSGVFKAVDALVSAISGTASGSGIPVTLPPDMSLCDAVQDCIGSALCGLSDRISGLEAVDYSSLSCGISSLASAVCGIGSGLADIKSGISGLPAKIVQAIIDAGDDPSASEPIRRAAAKVAAAGTPEDNGIVKPVVQDLNSDVNNPAVFGEGGVEDSLEDASNALSGISESVSSGASSDAQAAASAADDAKTTVDSEKSAVEAVGNFVP